MKIITFPFAGGNQYSFNFLRQNLLQKEDYLEVQEYPGRGSRIKDSLIENINELVSDLSLQIIREIDLCENYIIYGHSMGAIVGYLFCQKIEKMNLKRPTKLIVSGAKSPKYSIEKIISNLSDSDFWKEVSELGGIPDELNNHPELIDYFIPILKADFKCIENYKYDKNASPLTIPIDVFYGSDEDMTQEEVDAWKEETTGNVNVTKLQGNHFFIFDHKEFFVEYFKKLKLNAIA